MKKVSLETISKELGVSKTLVSFVLNGKGDEMKISQTMQEKVLAKAKELNYKGNPMARALRTGRSKTIGLIVADIANPFFSKLARSVEDEAMKNGYNIFYGSSDEESEKSIRLMDLFQENLVDGLLICPSIGDEEYIQKLQDNKVPNVLVDRYIPGLKSNVVVTNNASGSFELVTDLVKKGCKRIAMVTYKEGLSTVDLRIEGYKRALKEANLEFDETLIRKVAFKNIKTETENAIRGLIDSTPDLDAVFFFNNELSYYGGQTIKEHLNKDETMIRIASFDSFEYVRHLNLIMKYGIQPIEELGRRATRLLIDQINSQKSLVIKEVLPIAFGEFR